MDSAVPMEKSATRILDAMRAAGVKQIDYLVTSHYDNDHIGTVKMLAQKVPIVNFVDHGPPSHPEYSNNNQVSINYAKEREKGKHIVPEPGDSIGINGVDVRVVTNQGNASVGSRRCCQMDGTSAWAMGRMICLLKFASPARWWRSHAVAF